MAVGARPLVEVTGTCRFDLITVIRDLTTQESDTWDSIASYSSVPLQLVNRTQGKGH